MGARTDLPAACIRATRHGRLSIERRSLRFTHGSAGHVRTSVAATGQGPRLPVPTRHGLLPGASLRTAAKNPHSTHHPCPNWGPRSYYLNAQSSVMGKIRQYDKLRDAIEQMLNMTKIPSVMVSRSIMNVITDKVAASLHERLSLLKHIHEGLDKRKYAFSKEHIIYLVRAYFELDETGELGFEMMKMMERKGLTADADVFVPVLRHHCKKGEIDRALEILSYLESEGMVVEQLYRVILIAYARQKKLQGIRETIERMKYHGVHPTVHTYTATMTAVTECKGRYSRGVVPVIWDMMVEDGVMPNDFTYALLLEIFNGKRTNEEPDFEAVEQLLEHMHASGRTGNVVVWTSVLSAYARHGTLDDVMRTFKRMEMLDIAPNELTFMELMKIFNEAGNMEAVTLMREEMQRHGIPLSEFSYSLLMKATASRGDVEGAVALLQDMMENQITPDRATWNCLIHTYCTNRDMAAAWKVFEHLRDNTGSNPCVITYGSLAEGYASTGDQEGCWKVIEEMTSHGVRPTEQVFNALVRLYATIKDKDGVMDVMQLMDQYGVEPGVFAFRKLLELNEGENDIESLYHTCVRMLESGYHIPKDIHEGLLVSLGQSLPKYDEQTHNDSSGCLVTRAREELAQQILRETAEMCQLTIAVPRIVLRRSLVTKGMSRRTLRLALEGKDLIEGTRPEKPLSRLHVMKYVAVASSMAIRLRANVVYDHYERANITMLGLVKQAMEELHKALVVGVERNVTVDELGCGGSHVPLAVEHVIQMPDEPRIRTCEMTVGEFVNLSKRKSIDSAIDILFGRQTPVTVDLDGWDMNILARRAERDIIRQQAARFESSRTEREGGSSTEAQESSSSDPLSTHSDEPTEPTKVASDQHAMPVSEEPAYLADQAAYKIPIDLLLSDEIDFGGAAKQDSKPAATSHAAPVSSSNDEAAKRSRRRQKVNKMQTAKAQPAGKARQERGAAGGRSVQATSPVEHASKSVSPQYTGESDMGAIQEKPVVLRELKFRLLKLIKAPAPDSPPDQPASTRPTSAAVAEQSAPKRTASAQTKHRNEVITA